jgi:outer membrane protein assembly factor BamB
MHRLVTVAALLLSAAAARADWPQWRGPNRDGVAVGAQLPRDWPKKAPPPLWKVAVGPGFSAPVVAAGRLYILHLEPGDRETCLCLDAATGKELWKHGYHAPYKPPDPTAGLGPKSTPTVDGDRVYAYGVAGMFHCLDARTGKVLWKIDCNREFWGVEKDEDGDDAYATSCGAAASPLIDGDRVILPIGGKKAGGMTAFDKYTGKVVWKSLTDRSSYASPLVSELAGVRQVVGFTGLRMAGLQASDGKLLWDLPFPAAFEQTSVTPVLWKDLVIVNGEYKPATALRVRNDNGKVVKETAWRNKDMRTYMVTPVVYQDHLYGLNRRQQLVCVALATGKTEWAGGNLDEFVSLVRVDDRLLVQFRNGLLYVIAADPKAFRVIASYELSAQGGVWSHLAVAGSRLYIKDKTHLICYDFGGK